MTMKASELRPGNWIDTKDFHTKESRGIHQYESKWWRFVYKFQPISLTEEWLLKSGCDKIEDYFELDRFRLRWLHPYKYFYVTDVHSGGYFTKLEFVHEWQNFYFILQGEELTFKN